MSSSSPLTIGITLGDMNGVGPELLLRSLIQEQWHQHHHTIIYGQPSILNFYQQQLDLPALPLTSLTDISQKKIGQINVILCGEEGPIQPGQATPQSGKNAYSFLQQAKSDFTTQQLDTLVTGPIDKHTVKQKVPGFIGHTEYLGQAFQVDDPLMLMTTPSMKVGLVTGHLPLRQVASSLTTQNIKKKLRLLAHALHNDFQYDKPKIAVMGLNPHAGDNGLLGEEESQVITPALQQVQLSSTVVDGPFSPDGFFGSQAYQQYHAILGMYHDQVLSPFKTLFFHTGINFTAGLPFVRTAPDHGPAFSLAGTGEADPTSFNNAIHWAIQLTQQRQFT